jgi:hypothetical protein
MNVDLERDYESAVLVLTGYYPIICLDGLRESTKTSIRIDS